MRTIQSLLQNPILATTEQYNAAVETFFAQLEANASGGPIADFIKEAKAALATQIVANANGHKVALIRIEGLMTVEDSLSHYGARSIAADIASAKSKGANSILIDVDSGGGAALAGHLIDDAVLRAKASGLKVYAIAHTAGSAAYRAIQNADKIYASNAAARLGSIGAFISINNAMVEFYKTRYTDIYAKQSTEKNKPLRLFMADRDASLIEAEATALAQAFIDEVAASRNPNSDVFKGAMYTAETAIKLGLADELGSTQHILNSLSVASETEVTLKPIEEMKSIISFLNSTFGLHLGENASTADVEAAIAGLPTVNFAQMEANTADLQRRLATAEATITELSQAALTEEQVTETVTGAIATAIANFRAELASEAAAAANGGQTSAKNESGAHESVEKFTTILNSDVPDGDSEF